MGTVLYHILCNIICLWVSTWELLCHNCRTGLFIKPFLK